MMTFSLSQFFWSFTALEMDTEDLFASPQKPTASSHLFSDSTFANTFSFVLFIASLVHYIGWTFLFKATGTDIPVFSNNIHGFSHR